MPESAKRTGTRVTIGYAPWTPAVTMVQAGCARTTEMLPGTHASGVTAVVMIKCLSEARAVGTTVTAASSQRTGERGDHVADRGRGEECG